MSWIAGTSFAAEVIDTAVFTFAVGDAATTIIPNQWTQGHGDIGIGYDGSALELHYHFEDGLNESAPGSDLELEPGAAYVRVADSARVTASAPAPFLDIATGEDAWILPGTGSVAAARGVPFVGLATEELDPSVFMSVELSLEDFSGPSGGEFALWQDGTLGGSPTVFMQTFGGIDAADSLNLGIDAHDHFNYGFTAPGIYEITLTARATAVPEPGSLAALASFGAFGFVWRRRRKVSTSPAAS